MPTTPAVVARLVLLFGGAVAAWAAGFVWLAVLMAVLALVGTVLAGDTKSVADAGGQQSISPAVGSGRTHPSPNPG